jgi:hypothetical protein
MLWEVAAVYCKIGLQPKHLPERATNNLNYGRPMRLEAKQGLLMLSINEYCTRNASNSNSAAFIVFGTVTFWQQPLKICCFTIIIYFRALMSYHCHCSSCCGCLISCARSFPDSPPFWLDRFVSYSSTVFSESPTLRVFDIRCYFQERAPPLLFSKLYGVTCPKT